MPEEKSPEQLAAENAELLARVAALEERANTAETTNDDLTAKNAALASQNRTLTTGLGLVGAKAGLPKEVLDDIQRRRELGLNDQHATEAALRQHTHDIDLAAKKEAKRVRAAAAPAPAATSDLPPIGGEKNLPPLGNKPGEKGNGGGAKK